MAVSQFGLEGYGVRRSGSFAGKTTSAEPGGPHPVGVITRLALDGYGVRRYSSFAGKTGTVEPPVVVPPVETPPDALGGSTSLGGGSFNRKKWKKLLDEIRQQLADEQASLEAAKKRGEDIDYTARTARVEAIHQRAAALEATAAAQRFIDKVSRIEAQYRAALLDEDEDDIIMLLLH